MKCFIYYSTRKISKQVLFEQRHRLFFEEAPSIIFSKLEYFLATHGKKFFKMQNSDIFMRQNVAAYIDAEGNSLFCTPLAKFFFLNFASSKTWKKKLILLFPNFVQGLRTTESDLQTYWGKCFCKQKHPKLSVEHQCVKKLLQNNSETFYRFLIKNS